MGALYAQLLGPPKVRAGTTWIPLAASKHHQLLAYLAYQADWVSRAQLAGLFWGDLPDTAARRNLRKTLFKARALPWLEGLKSNDAALLWTIKTDLSYFLQAIHQETWSEAIRLYHGPLLTGMDETQSTEFGNWLTLKRERLHEQWRAAVLNQSEILVSRHLYHEALTLLQRLLDDTTFDETAVTHYVIAAVRAGERALALRTYRQFAQKLRAELDLSPTAELTALAAEIQSSEFSVASPLFIPSKSAAHRAATNNLPVAVTPFIGREAELAELTALLAQPDCRLLTLTGPGGSGKSRLAIEAAQIMASHYEGVYFIALEAINSAAAITPKLAELLGLLQLGQRDPLMQLQHHLGDRQVLLVLDNFEHLIAGISVLTDLLTACPHLKLLVTSRERLSASGEWVLPVAGLSFSQAAIAPEAAHSYDAVRMFTVCARRVKPTFQLDSSELNGVLEICRQVAGLPLAIELAAVWVRLMSCSDIAHEIAQTTDFLAHSHPHATNRHQSLRAVFEHSWKLLNPDEQQYLRRLSVFKGGFNRNAARQVSGVPLTALTSLVDKSLLRPVGSDHFDQHPLIYTYTQEKLSEHVDELSQVQAAHTEYYLQLAISQSRETTDRRKALLDLLDSDLENTLLAWRELIRSRRLTELVQLAEILTWYCDVRARHKEGRQYLAEAISALDDQTDSHQHALGTLWAHCAWLEHWSDNDRAATAAHQALQRLRTLNAPQETASAFRTLGLIAWRHGDYGEAEAYFRDALQLTGLTDASRAVLLDALGMTLSHRGDYDEATTCHLSALRTNEQLRNSFQIVHNLVNLASIARRTGQLHKGLSLAEHAFSLSEATGFEHYRAYCLSELSWLHLSLEDYSKAIELSQQALSLAQKGGDTYIQTKVLTILALCETHTGEVDQALSYLTAGLQVAWTVQDFMALLQLLYAAAQLAVRCSVLTKAITWAEVVTRHPASPHWCAVQANDLLTQLLPSVPETVAHQAKIAAEQTSLAALMTDIPALHQLKS
jgi:predicted ATPase/DNA-binding SARP family transcriptional activator